ncbi:MAG: metallophosphoesterase [Burkholderiaceae bacterium]
MTPLDSAPKAHDDEWLAIPVPSRALRRFDINTRGRDFFVGDIHGSFSALRQALDTVLFDERVDRLFSVGDLVDRGPESERVLEWLDLPWFHAICGNHDFMIWRAALDDPYPDVDFLLHGGEWLLSLDDAQRRRIGERLRELPFAIEVQTEQGIVGSIHADCPFKDWEHARAFDWPRLDPAGPLGKRCLWMPMRFAMHRSLPVANARAIVHGHVTVPVARTLGNVHYIDTGGWRPGGHFTLLQIDSMTALRGTPAEPVPLRRRLFGRLLDRLGGQE